MRHVEGDPRQGKDVKPEQVARHRLMSAEVDRTIFLQREAPEQIEASDMSQVGQHLVIASEMTQRLEPRRPVLLLPFLPKPPNDLDRLDLLPDKTGSLRIEVSGQGGLDQFQPRDDHLMNSGARGYLVVVFRGAGRHRSAGH
ncbi:hypothetical protein U5903_12390 [Cereibacter johrii]|uniref:hypothetical protein n=1 Tax=Cereibacter johrii TaxID=445629 RepID=UPI002B25D93D|nr:hypothetical protein [Cereibacter johrii]MEA5161568.1 hypothetical protein [Cereibacter johrii]